MNIMKKLYNGNIAEIHRTRKNKNINKELAVLEKLKVDCNNHNLLKEYLGLLDERNEQNIEDSYIQGFKTGLLIGIETNKTKL